MLRSKKERRRGKMEGLVFVRNRILGYLETGYSYVKGGP